MSVCVRLSSLKNENVLLSTRNDQVVKLTLNDIEAKETLQRQTDTATTTFLSLGCELHSSNPHNIVPLLPVETDGQFSSVTDCCCQLGSLLVPMWNSYRTLERHNEIKFKISSFMERISFLVI